VPWVGGKGLIKIGKRVRRQMAGRMWGWKRASHPQPRSDTSQGEERAKGSVKEKASGGRGN